jgi:hypothetical protein
MKRTPLDLMTAELKRQLPKVDISAPPVFSDIWPDEAKRLMEEYEAQPKFRSELARRCAWLDIGNAFKLAGMPMQNVKNRVAGFGKQYGKKFKVFPAADGATIVVRKE